jgi:LytS/YehU family sensor histidine kinase
MKATKRVPVIAVLVAACVVTNYALAGLPNISFMDFIVFIGGFLFGPLVGALIGVLSWTVYGFINPYGFLLQIYFTTMFTEALYGVAGGILGRNLASTSLKDQKLSLCVMFGVLACMLTLTYDVITNIVFAITFEMPIILAIVFGVPFMFAHVFSNILIFSLGSIPTVNAIKKILR